MLLSGMHCLGQVTVFSKVSDNAFVMQDLKDLQNELVRSLIVSGIPAKVTESYPSYAGFQLGFQMPVAKFGEHELLIGIYGDYTSTGGRIHYQDYSGEVKYDQVAIAHSVGALMGVRTRFSQMFHLDVNASVRLVGSTLRYGGMMRIAGNTQSSNWEFTSTAVGFEFGVLPTLDVLGFGLGVSASYLVYPPSTLELSSNEDAHLLHANGKDVLIDWSGLKLGVVLSYEL